MTIEEVLDHYGSTYRFSEITGMSHANIPNWKKRGYIPIESQIRLERLSEGALRADLSHCDMERDDVNL